MSDREAMKLALEALEWAWGGEPMGTKEQAAMQALRDRLAEPEPEPATDAKLLLAYRQRGCGFYMEFKEIWQVAERFHGIVKEVQP